MRRVIVIGGGAAGMAAAYFAARSGDRVKLFEKNEKLGKKVYITGKGRCNVTNYCEPDEFLTNVMRSPRFLTGAVNRFPPKKLYELLENNGLKLKVERGNRVFPLSDKSNDVIKCFYSMLDREGVNVTLGIEVRGINVENGAVKSVSTDRGDFECDKVIVCTGGITYPATGSTGDGYIFAKACGHTVIEPRGSLCGMVCSDSDLPAAQGLSLKNVEIVCKKGKKTVFSEQGEAVITHFGISGPIVLTASAYLARENLTEYEIYIDLKPALTAEELDKRLLRDFSENINRDFCNALGGLLPQSLIEIVVKRSGIPPEKKVNSITAAERAKLGLTLKHLTLSVTGLQHAAECIITAGGVSVKELNPSNMESKLVKGLFFAGEVIDVDAKTGGFNMQIAFSTAFAAGECGDKL